ncbi:3-isopropylmalate dehydratase large subunit [Candidatus Leptofilum sp.]|uniref:3-isopropylmalate dehydratase large subunit n=1 Tax=Candidatus Leptofilum sp. TaxID=3241576 RepID=UPI003B5C7CAD
MGQTLTEQILSNKAGTAVQPGDLIVIEPDVAMGHDSLSPGIIKILQERLLATQVHNPEQVVLVMDHVAPAATVGVADNQNKVRRFAQEQGLRLFEIGRGICHQVLVEEGIAQPGSVIIGSDSHSTSYGAVGAFGTGMGSTDIALAWATGKTWLRVPETICIQATGRFQPGVDAKDLALKLCRILGIGGATYRAVEYHGLEWLPLNGRQTISSMAIELGAKVGIFPPNGEVADRYEVPDWLYVDPTANYDQRITLDLTTLQPQIAVPHSVDAVVDLGDVAGTPVDVVFLGTCTNGRYEDMHTAASILRGRRLADGVRLIVSPASRVELQRAIADDTLNILLESGATLTTPGCGPCMGRHQGTLGREDVCLSTGNRNFRGRMGHPTSQIYLSSPAVAAATAVTGTITDPREIEFT